MAPNYEVRQVDGKGYGVVATQRISRSSLIFQDKPLLTVQRGRSPSELRANIENAFERLTEEDQQTYMALHDSGSPMDSKIVRIFNNNAFQDEDTSQIYPLITRLNHSCLPNAMVSARGVNAIKDIAPGEEIQICYKEDWDEVLTAPQRALMYQAKWLQVPVRRMPPDKVSLAE